MDLHRAVVTVHRGRGLTVTRRSRYWPRARAGRPERKGDAGSDQRRTGNEGEIRTPGNKGHSMPPLVEELGPYRTIAGDRVTVTPSLGPSSSAQTPASPEPDPCRVLVTASLTNLSGLVIPENIVAVRPVSHSWSCPTRLRRSRTPVTAPSRHACVWRFRGQPRRTSRPASRPWPVTSAGLVRQAAPAGRRPPANTAAGRARAPISATGSPSATSRSASDRGPRPALAVLEAARVRGQRGRRRQRGGGAHAAFNQESCRDGQQAVRFGGGN